MSLTGKTKASSYKDILQMNNSNSGVDGVVRKVVDGEGTASALYLSNDVVKIVPQDADSTFSFIVGDKDNNTLFKVDSSNDLVKAGAGQHIVNTQYAHFGTGSGGIQSIATNKHYPIAFNTGQLSSGLTPPNLGTGTDPATTFTTSEASALRASDIVCVLWHIPDNITIDEITHLEGADAATGDTTRMHLMSYDFTSGATACLTNGAVVANTSADNTNAGSEQPYLKAWTVGSPDVDADKVVLCTFRNDSINSDYSVSVTIKYHLR
tara:strand:- start:110 stop:907 length:798 start_codon:yes stop_codon:yes gene_type:complete